MRLVNPYKLLVLDIDGTLLDKNGVISAEDRNALARVGDLGLPVSLSTGRVVQACLGIISQLSLDSYHMFFDGALVSNPNHGKEIYIQPIDKMVVKQAVELAHLKWLSGMQRPDFRKNNIKVLKKLFKQVVQICQRLRMVSLGLVAIDGTKVKAAASDYGARPKML